MISRAVIVVLLLMFLCAPGVSQTSTDFNGLYETHDWFKLREAVKVKGAPTFYRGVVAASLNHTKDAERYLNSTIKTSPASQQAFEALTILTQVYLRNGKYRQGIISVDRALRINSNDKGLTNVRSLFAALNQYPEQLVARREHSRLQYSMKDGNLFIPLSVNGQQATSLVDSGANFSLISVNEAKRLGLTIHDANGSTMEDSAGASVDFQLALAGRLKIGKCELRNVVFFVMKDDQQPFVELPLGERLILGLPVLLGLESIRWDRNGNFETGFTVGHGDRVNMAYEGSELLVEGSFEQAPIKVFIDTGATRTRVLSRFAREFEEVVTRNGKRSSDRMTGVGAEIQVESRELPVLNFRITGTDLSLRPAQVLLKDTATSSQWYHVWIGMDLLREPNSVTIDFKSMRMEVR